jgi:hypothetical protein
MRLSQGEVHRLIDGGVWANYPAFVFKDRSFREHHQLASPPTTSITVGFTLEHPARSAQGEPAELLSWRQSPGDKGGLLRGWLRIAPLRLYFMTLVPIVVVLQAGYTIDQWGLLFLKDTTGHYRVSGAFGSIAAFFNGFFTHFVGFYSVLVAIGLLAVVLALLGATLLDSGAPAMRTLMAVGTNIPYWAGTTEGDHVVRLTVPPGLGTMAFRLDPAKINMAVDDAHNEASDQLDSILTPLADRQ